MVADLLACREFPEATAHAQCNITHLTTVTWLMCLSLISRAARLVEWLMLCNVGSFTFSILRRRSGGVLQLLGLCGATVSFLSAFPFCRFVFNIYCVNWIIVLKSRYHFYKKWKYKKVCVSLWNITKMTLNRHLEKKS